MGEVIRRGILGVGVGGSGRSHSGFESSIIVRIIIARWPARTTG